MVKLRELLATLWPLFALGAEAIFLYLVISPTSLPPTPLSISVAIAVLLSGLTPALIRPSPDTRLAALLAILLASLLVMPFEITSFPGADSPPWLSLAPGHAILRLYNGALALTVAFHLTLRFPPRENAHRPGALVLAGVYVGSLFLITGLLLAPAGPARLLLTALAALWFGGLLLLTYEHLLQTAHARGPSHQRSAQQARLLLLGFTVAETPLILRLLFFVAGQGEIIPFELALAAQVAVPISVAYATLRHDLFDIDAAVRRGLAYGVVLSLLLAAYFSLTLFLSRVVVRSLPRFQGMAIFVGLLAAAVAFRPLYSRIQHLVDRLFYPERLRFHTEIAALRRDLQQLLSQEEIVRLLNTTLPARLGALWGRLILAPDHDTPDPASAPPAWNTRLIVGERLLGRYWLGPRRSGLSYDANERAQLQALLQQAALALAYAEALSDLNTLNENLERQVALQTAQVLDQQRALAASEERQRLARDLHDSVTQTLFSISLGARALRKLALQDPQAVAEALGEQETAAQQALREMRSLLAQLRSPFLSDGNLGRALQQHCALLEQQTGLHVHLDTPDSLPLTQKQANELFLIARECLHNVVKHGNVQEAFCQVHCSSEQVTLIVRDQGRGFEPARVAASGRAGMGLQSMRERAAALGGHLFIDTAPEQGTRIEVRIPLAPPGGPGK